jgi:hypothetical protein
MGVRPQRWALNDTEDSVTEELMVQTLVDLLENGSTDQDETEEVLAGLARVSTFSDEMMLTSNAGLVVRLDDGTEFQVTVVQSKRGSDG